MQPRLNDKKTTVEVPFPYLALAPSLLMYISTFLADDDINQLNHALIGFYLFYFKQFPAANTCEVSAARTYPMGAFLHRHFKWSSKGNRLLQDVLRANYIGALDKAQKDPSAIFQVIYRYDGRVSEEISPLKAAFRACDTYMWRLFWDKIKTDPHYVDEYLKQWGEQITHLIDLNPLFVAYEEYDKQRLLHLYRKITAEQMKTSWCHLAMAQRDIVPSHMWKEFSRPGPYWKPDSTFNAEVVVAPPMDCMIMDFHISATGIPRALPFILSDKEWGKSFLLVRGGTQGKNQARALAVKYTSFREDLVIFRRLFEMRAKDLSPEKMSSLLIKSHLSPDLLTPYLPSLRPTLVQIS